MNGISIPPPSETGLAVIPNFEDNDLIFTKDKNGKPNTFAITMPSGYSTIFEIDLKTNIVKSYRTTFELNGIQRKSQVEIDNYKNVNGVMIPEKFVQSFDFGQATFYVKYSAKKMDLNIKLDEDVFVLK